MEKLLAKVELPKHKLKKRWMDLFRPFQALLAGGDKITLVGFGTFSVGSRSQREGRNPRTGEKIKIPASKVVKFKAGKTLSEKVK